MTPPHTHAQDEHDWVPYNKEVYAKLKKYHEQGYKIVIFR